MVSITKKVAVSDGWAAWQAAYDFGNAHHAFAGVLADCTLEDDVRMVTFTNGMVVKERLIGIDEGRRRIAYAVIDGPFAHHNASFQIRDNGVGGGVMIWTCDILPDEASAMVEPLMQAGIEAFARNLEAVT
ncbi:SRPBCC family protein [Sphingomonas cavernae]|nr:SRPBCC family protein [Sphingomonas cavernae]